jgi:surfeit locus 1 family protein
MGEKPREEHRSKRRRRSLLSALLATGTLAFAALGVWQVERRTEKLALIAAVEQRVHAPPADASGPGEWPRITFRNDAYRHIRVGGVFLHDRETLVQAVTERGPGYWVMTPLRTDGDWMVLVNRGFVPDKTRDRAGDPSGHVTVTGLLRTSEPGGGFLRSNDRAHDRWYSRDVGAIGRARRLERLAPYFIDAEAVPRQDHQPIGGLTRVRFPNNHLQYAFTWFALAALSALGVARIRRGR